MTQDQAESFIHENSKLNLYNIGEWIQFGIENIETGRLIGDCAIKFERADSRIAQIGITISHLEQKRGFAKEALLEILRLLFDFKGIHRVVEIVDAENIAAIRLFRSLGFKREGHFVENIFFKGKWGSEIQFAMLKKDWTEKRVI